MLEKPMHRGRLTIISINNRKIFMWPHHYLKNQITLTLFVTARPFGIFRDISLDTSLRLARASLSRVSSSVPKSARKIEQFKKVCEQLALFNINTHKKTSG